MHATLRSLRNQTLGNMQGPEIRFFTPNYTFFNALEPYKDKMLVDAGAGTGMVSKEAAEHGFDMLAIDIMPRDGQWGKVVLLDAESVPYSDDRWLLLCRPDHSGWAYDVLELALRRGASVFYAGLERNLSIDLGEYVGRESMKWARVGEDGEDLFLFEPSCLLPSVAEADTFSSVF